MGYAGAITADGLATQRGAANDTLDATYLQAAMEARRAMIEAVPGSGDILGCCIYKGVEYAWRNNAGGTAAVMWKATSNGWEEIPHGNHLDFDAGTDEMIAGDIVTGQTSGATATITCVHKNSGTWAGGDAAGTIHFTTHHGDFIDGEKLTTARLTPTTSADTDGIILEENFAASGKFEFDIYNFGGHSGSTKLYGVDGVSNGMEYDGSNLTFLHTGMTTDTPDHVIAHKKHLFYMFSGGSVQHSSLGDPHTWSAITGAAEIGLGDEGTGFKKTPGGRLSMYTLNKTYILQGTSVSDWVLAEHSEESGAIEWSIQRLASPIYLDDRGLTTLNAVQDYGDFKDNVISDLVQPYLDSRTENVQTSMIVKEKNQYRIFFDDSTALYFTFKNNKLRGATVVKLGKKVTAAFSGEDTDGSEVLLFGSTDGYVYKLDSGTNFDGDQLVSSFRVPYHHYGSPGINKRFLSVTLELDLQDPLSTNLSLYPDFTFSDTNAPKAVAQTVDPGPGGGIWGAVNWGDFSWGGGLVGEAFAHIDGHGRNMGLLITSSSTYEKPHTIHGITVGYSLRNRRR